MRPDHKRLHIVANADGAALLDANAGTISTLNATGAQIWLGLERREAPDAIAEKLACETREHIDTVKKDVREFIESLRKKNLLPE